MGRWTGPNERERANAQIDAMLKQYADRGVPRIHAIRAGIRALELRGVQNTSYGKKCLRRLRLLLEKEEGRRESR